MRTDAFDRFCTRTGRRFTRAQIAEILQQVGFEKIVFSTREPFGAVATLGHKQRDHACA